MSLPALRGTLIALFLAIALAYVGLIAAMKIQGGQVSTMISSSMAPAFPQHSIALTVPSTHEDFVEGDLIGFVMDGGSILKIHRVHDITENGLVTKGDALAEQDPTPLTEHNSAVYEVVFTSHPLGWVWKYVPWIASTLLLMVAATFIRWETAKWSLFFFGAGCVLAAAVFVLSPIRNMEFVEFPSNARIGGTLKVVNAGVVPFSVSIEGDGKPLGQAIVPSREIFNAHIPGGYREIKYVMRPERTLLSIGLFTAGPLLAWFAVGGTMLWQRMRHRAVSA